MKATSAIAAAALALALTPAAFAQAQPPPPTRPDPAADEPISLTAFTVSASSDVGYMATIGSSDPIPVFTNPNGEIALVRVPPLTEWLVTNTFRF